MKRWIILILTALIVAAGAFLPELMLTNDRPEGNFSGRQVEITSASLSDYVWRMERIAKHAFGEGLVTTYIPSDGPAEEVRREFLDALELFAREGIVPASLPELAESREDYQLHYYYLFDTEAISGLRIAEFTVSGTTWRISMCMDMESGKIAKLEYGGSKLIPDKLATPETSWYDVLRSFGEYLGLSSSPSPLPEPSAGGEPDSKARQYYDNCTAERRLAALEAGDTAWLELRVLRENFSLTIAVYDGGR